MVRSMTPPLPKNYPALKPLFSNKEVPEGISCLDNNSYVEANEFNTSSPEFSSSEVGSPISDATSPGSNSSIMNWITTERMQQHDTQLPIEEVAQNHIKSSKSQEANLELVNCQLRSRWLGTIAGSHCSGETSLPEICVERAQNGGVKQIKFKETVNEDHIPHVTQEKKAIRLQKITMTATSKRQWEKVIEDITARQLAINYITRNTQILDNKAGRYIFEKVRTDPRPAYWKMITQRDCVDEVRIQFATKYEYWALREIIDDVDGEVANPIAREDHVEMIIPERSRLFMRRRQISQLLKAKENRRLVLKDISARQLAINYLTRNLWILDKKAVQYLLEKLKTAPNVAYWKMITQEDCVEEVRIRRAAKFEADALKDVIDDVNEEIVNPIVEEDYMELISQESSRFSARRRQIQEKLTAKENKRVVLNELRLYFLESAIQQLRQKRGRVIMDMPKVDLNKEVQKLKQKRGKVILDIAFLDQAQRRNSNIRAHLKNNVRELLQVQIKKLKQQRGGVLLKMADFRDAERRNNRLEMRLKEAIREDVNQRLVDAYKNSVENTSDRGLVVVSDPKLIERSRVGSTRPGPKEFFVKTIVHRLLAKRGSNRRDPYQAWQQVGMPRQTYLKFAVNKVIQKIRIIRERQQIRQIKRNINQEILTMGTKALVIHEINKLSLNIQQQVGLLPRRQSRLKQMEMNDDGMKSVLIPKTSGLEIEKELKRLRLRRGNVVLEMDRVQKESSSTILYKNCQSSSIRVIQKVRRKLLEKARLRKQSQKMVKAIQQIGKARMLKKEINTIIETHFHIKQVVLEIKTRFRAVQLKDRMIDELKGYITQFEKQRANRKFLKEQRTFRHGDPVNDLNKTVRKVKLKKSSWREQRTRLHKDLHEYFRKAKLAMDKEDDLSWIRKMPISRQMSLKWAVNQEIRQRQFKKAVQLELVTRFRTVDLKSKLCREILKNAQNRVSLLESWPVRSTHQWQDLSKLKHRLHSIPENACLFKHSERPFQISEFLQKPPQREEQRVVKKQPKTQFIGVEDIISKKLTVRAKVGQKKCRLLMELKVHSAKTKCMYAIRQRTYARMNYDNVILELKQRINYSKCVKDIYRGSYQLKHVPRYSEISPAVILKQQMNVRKVNTVIKQAAQKSKVNQEIITRGEQCKRKASVTREIRNQSANLIPSKEGRAKVKIGSIKSKYKGLTQELEQRYRQKEIVKEIKMRQKQIFWKHQSCIIIKQGGHKVRVNEEIRRIAHKKEVERMKALTQKGSSNSPFKEELERRMIGTLKTREDLKAKGTNGSDEVVATWPNRMTNHGENGEEHISAERTKIMKLVKLVTRLSETNEKQEQVIRNLTLEIRQQRADFVTLNQRVVNDKKVLYRELEHLTCENQKLTRTLVKREAEEKQMNSLHEPQSKDVCHQKKLRQTQQIPLLIQEMQELGNTIPKKMFGRVKDLSYQNRSFHQCQAVQEPTTITY